MTSTLPMKIFTNQAAAYTARDEYSSGDDGEGEQVGKSAKLQEHVIDVPATETTVWVLTVDHRHGTNVTVHTSEDDARDELVGYVHQWWADCGLEEYDMADDDQQAVDQYFERIRDESYSLSQTVLKQAKPVPPVYTVTGLHESDRPAKGEMPGVSVYWSRENAVEAVRDNERYDLEMWIEEHAEDLTDDWLPASDELAQLREAAKALLPAGATWRQPDPAGQLSDEAVVAIVAALSEDKMLDILRSSGIYIAIVEQQHIF